MRLSEAANALVGVNESLISRAGLCATWCRALSHDQTLLFPTELAVLFLAARLGVSSSRSPSDFQGSARAKVQSPPLSCWGCLGVVSFNLDVVALFVFAEE